MAILTDDDLQGHVFIVGSTGAGKTNLLLHLMQYLSSRNATIIAIDPHGDLALDLKGTVPSTAVYDPVLSPFALNPLDLGSYESPEERTQLVQRKVGEVVDMMKDLFGVEQSKAPRLLWIFRGLLYYLYSLSDTPTFLDLYFLLSDLLSDPSKVKRLMRGSEEVIRRSAEAMSELEPTAFTAVMNRISNFVLPAGSYTSRTFCVRKTTVDFLGLTETGKVSVFRLSRNQLPDDFRKILTATIVINVFYAVERRKKIYDSKGIPLHPVFLVIDEFQTIAYLDTLDEILSEARKFGLFLYSANQHLAQIPETLLKSLETNSKLLVSFRVGPDDAHELAKAMGDPKLEATLTMLPNYAAIVKRMDRVYYFRVPKARYPQVALAEIENTIKTNVTLEEDRSPIYSTGSVVPFSPAQWAVLAYLFLHGPNVPYDDIKNEMFRKYAWDESVTISALNCLLDMGYTRAIKTSSGLFYSLSEEAMSRFFTSTESVASKRAGGALHNEMVRRLVRRFWESGYYVEVDTGDEPGEKPDLLVFRPAETVERLRDVIKVIRDPDEWERPVAYEVETMTNSAEQIRHNLEKNLAKGYPVVFVVPDIKAEEKLKEMIGGDRYSVAVL